MASAERNRNAIFRAKVMFLLTSRRQIKFDKYIRENLQWPDTLYSGQKAIVVLGFPVPTDGSIDSIKIIRSPGKPFSDEAIRLLRSGPSWQPAVDNGQIIEDQVRLRIVFK